MSCIKRKYALKVYKKRQLVVFPRPPGYGSKDGWGCTLIVEGQRWNYRLVVADKRYPELTWIRECKVEGQKHRKREYFARSKGYGEANPPREVLEYLLRGGVGRRAALKHKKNVV